MWGFILHFFAHERSIFSFRTLDQLQHFKWYRHVRTVRDTLEHVLWWSFLQQLSFDWNLSQSRHDAIPGLGSKSRTGNYVEDCCLKMMLRNLLIIIRVSTCRQLVLDWTSSAVRLHVARDFVTVHFARWHPKDCLLHVFYLSWEDYRRKSLQTLLRNIDCTLGPLKWLQNAHQLTLR